MKKKLGEILVSSGMVSKADIADALSDQSAGEPSRLGDLLVAAGKLSATQLAQALAQQYEVPFVELPPLPQAVLDLVPLDLQRQFRFVPLRSEGTELSIAMADLADREVLPQLETQWTKVNVAVASGEEIDALHATLSGLFKPPEPVSTLQSEDLFGSLELDEPIAPPVPVARPAPPRAEDLFGDLNLESSRTGIPAEAPEVELEGSGPVITAERVGTGPLLDLVAREGTGPVVDTPFFRDAAGDVVPSIPDLPFQVSDSAILAAQTSAPPVSTPSSISEPLPDWLGGGTRPAPPVAEPQAWTGALDHLAPSKLVLGLTRALLARGLVTEAEILAALGPKR